MPPIDYVFAPLCPEFENLPAAQIAKARAEGKTALAMQILCRKYDLHLPMDDNVTEDGRQPESINALTDPAKT